MKESKKLKNLINNDGEKIKANNVDFCQKMFDTYYKETPAVEKKKAIDFSWLFSRRALSGLCVALILVVAIPIVVSQSIKIRNDRLHQLENSGTEIVLPSNTEIVSALDETKFNINTDKLTKVSNGISLTFGNRTVVVDKDASISEDVRLEDGYRKFYYVTDIIENVGMYRLQIIFDKNMERTSLLGENQSQIEVANLKFKYSIIYATNIKTAYFFAEAETENELFVVSFSTSQTDCEKAFNEFLQSIIK